MGRRVLLLLVVVCLLALTTAGPVRNYRDVDHDDHLEDHGEHDEHDLDRKLIRPEPPLPPDHPPPPFTTSTTTTTTTTTTEEEEEEDEDDDSNEKTAGTTIHFVKPKEDCGIPPELELGSYDCDANRVFEDEETCNINCDSGGTTSLLCKCREDMVFFKMFVGCRWVWGFELGEENSCPDLIIKTTTTTTTTTQPTTPTSTIPPVVTTVTTTVATPPPTTPPPTTAVVTTTPHVDEDGTVHGHGHIERELDAYRIHIHMLEDQVTNLAAKVALQQEKLNNQTATVDNLAGIQDTMSNLRRSLEGGTEYVEGFVVMRSNQLSLLTPEMVDSSIAYVSNQVDTSNLLQFGINNIIAVTRETAEDLIHNNDQSAFRVRTNQRSGSSDPLPFEFYFQVYFHAEMESTLDPAERAKQLVAAWDSVPGIELDSLAQDYTIYKNNRDLRLDDLERHVEELDHFVAKNVSHLNSEVDTLYQGLRPITSLGDAVNKTASSLAAQVAEVEALEREIVDLEADQMSNEWNLESLADQVDRLDQQNEMNDYIRSDIKSIKEHSNLQEIKQLMLSQELQRIITLQDQKIAKQSADLAQVQAALIEERYLKRMEMADYEKRVRTSITLEMDIMMAKMESFFEAKMAKLDERDKTGKLFHELLTSRRPDVDESQVINLKLDPKLLH